MASEENLEFLAEEHRRYIIGTPKSLLKKFEAELLKQDWREVHAGLEVKLCASPEGKDETFILCRSAARKEKEQAMHDRFIERLEKSLQKVQATAAKGKPKDPNVLWRRIGRLLERYSRAASLFDITIKPDASGRAVVSWKFRPERSEWARLSEGCYLLRTNIHDWSPEELWKIYIGLTDAEAAFRVHKQDLELRPVFHQREDRVQSHILVCFLAYVLWKCLGQMCKRAGLGDEPRKLIDEIKRLTLVDVVLPTKTGRELRLRCVMRPEAHLAILLDRLGLRPPRRLDMSHKNVVQTF